MTPADEESELKRELAKARARLDDANAELRKQAEELGRLRAIAERLSEYERRLEEVEGRERPPSITIDRPAVATDVLAEQLRSVLDQLGEPSPAPDRQSAAVLNRLEVEARGVLLPAEEAGRPPELLTVDPTQVQTEALSTVRMTFALLPHVTPFEPGT